VVTRSLSGRGNPMGQPMGSNGFGQHRSPVKGDKEKSSQITCTYKNIQYRIPSQITKELMNQRDNCRSKMKDVNAQ
jgi:hypothetical protein